MQYLQVRFVSRNCSVDFHHKDARLLSASPERRKASITAPSDFSAPCSCSDHTRKRKRNLSNGRPKVARNWSIDSPAARENSTACDIVATGERGFFRDRAANEFRRTPDFLKIIEVGEPCVGKFGQFPGPVSNVVFPSREIAARGECRCLGSRVDRDEKRSPHGDYGPAQTAQNSGRPASPCTETLAAPRRPEFSRRRPHESYSERIHLFLNPPIKSRQC